MQYIVVYFLKLFYNILIMCVLNFMFLLKKFQESCF